MKRKYWYYYIGEICGECGEIFNITKERRYEANTDLWNLLAKNKETVGGRMNSYKLICEYSFWIALNANDFFGYACADCVKIDSDDLEWIIPFVKKYERDGINAVLAYIRQAKPLKPYITPEFELAYKEIEELNPEVYSERE